MALDHEELDVHRADRAHYVGWGSTVGPLPLLGHTRGPALECAACLDALVARKRLAPAEAAIGKQTLERIASMLRKMIGAVQPGPPSPSTSTSASATGVPRCRYAGADLELRLMARDDDPVDVEKVFEAFKRGLNEQVRDDAIGTHLDLAIAYTEMGLWPDAAAEFELVLRAEPNNEIARGGLALAHARMGNPRGDGPIGNA